MSIIRDNENIRYSHSHCLRFLVCNFMLKISNFLWLFLVFEIRKNLDLRKILVTPKIFLKSRFVCTQEVGVIAS